MRYLHLGTGRVGGTGSKMRTVGQAAEKNSVEANWRRNPRSGLSATSGVTERSRGCDRERRGLNLYWSVDSGDRVPDAGRWEGIRRQG